MSQEVKTTFKRNGFEFEFDIRDAEQSEKYEDAIEHLRDAENKLPKTGKMSQILKGQCEMIKAFFNDTLGEGAGDKICTERNNITICYDAYNEFLVMVREQKNDIIRAKNTFGKYSNRQQHKNTHKNQ